MAESNPTQVILTDDGIKIIKAQNTADNAASGIKNINDPNYLSPFEKPQLKIQMDNFATIYAADKNIAKVEGIDFTRYEAAYQAYLSYMTPLVANMTTYSPIVRTVFNGMVTAVQVEQKRFNTATQSQYNQQINKARTDIDDGQTKYQALQSEAKIMESSVAGISDAADRAISSAGFASNTASAASQAASSAVASALSAESNASSAVSTANSTASAFGPVKQSADSAVASALSAESVASSAVSQASSAAADSKDAKQIAGAVSQSYKILTDGSTMTIAELQNGLAVKLTKKDLDGYATQDWSQNKIKLTADGINGTMSSIKRTVDGQTTNINDLKDDSKGFKEQFTTVTDAVGKHTTDIGTLQASSKELSSNFDSLSTDNGTNEHDISQLKQTAKGFSSTLTTVQTQVQNSAVGTNLLLDSQTQMRAPSWHSQNGGWTSEQGTYLGSNIYRTSNAWDNARYRYEDLFDRGVINTTDDFTYSIYFRVVGEDPAVMSYVNVYFFSSATDKNRTLVLQPTSLKEGQWARIVVTFKFNGRKYDPHNEYYDSLRVEMSASPKVKGAYYEFAAPKLEKGSLATDWCPNPEDTATVTAVSSISQTIHGIQTTVKSKASSSQLTQLSGQLTNKIKDLSSSTDSAFKQTANDINGMVKKGDVVNQFNIDAGGALLSTSGNSTKIVFSSPNIIFDSKNPVQIPNVNIPGTLTGKKFEAGTITATTKITGSDIEAPIIHSPSGSFKLDGNSGDIIGASIHSANNSWGIDKDGDINGTTINGATINAPKLDLGSNGTLTTDFNINQPTNFYAPKKGTGTLTIKTGIINANSQNMSRYSNTAAYWYGFDDNGNMVKNGTNQTGDDYAPGYEKHDIMKSNGNVLNRSYLDAMGLTLNEGGTKTFNTMLTAIGLETGSALLHEDLATNGTFKAALGTGNKYGFTIGSKVIAPMIRANEYTYAADVFISRYGTMGLSTSTKANKLDIADVPDMLQKGYNLLTLNPRQWFDKTSVEAYADVKAGNTDSVESVVDIKPVTGMVAEEVASAGLDDYVVKDENNKVQGLAYDRLWTLLLPVLRDMNDKINKLQKKEGI